MMCWAGRRMQQYEETDEGQKDRQSEAVVSGQRLIIVCQKDGRLPLHCQCHHFVTADIAFLIYAHHTG